MPKTNTSHYRKSKLNIAILAAIGSLSISGIAAANQQNSQDNLSIEKQSQQTTLEQVDSTVDGNEKSKDVEKIIVVGSSIKGANITGALPVTLIDASDIEAIGATSGIELFASIPSNGSVNFNGNDVVSGVYQSRGDVASINLRSIGTGNTLVLFNGRRMVQHPGTQTENSVPVTTVNMNSIPVLGIDRVEILHDGAAAIYGSDAVAGVVNTEMRKDFAGYKFDVQYGQAENTSREKLNINTLAGWDINDGMTNITTAINYYHGSEVMASEIDYAADADKRSFLVGTDWEGDTNFRNTSTTTPWGRFDASQSVTGLTSSAGRFHVEPVDATDSNQQCVLANGLCLDSGSITTNTQAYNTNSVRTMIPETERLNTFVYLNHELNDDVSLYGELGYYWAESNSQRAETATLTSAPVTIASTAYWNPLGSGPNRISGYDTPAEGLDISINAYRVVDAGTRNINVENTSYRVLGGATGSYKDWEWDSAALYSKAKTVDTTHNRISLSLFQDAVNRLDESAYNTFCGATCNSQETIDSFLIDVSRSGETALGLVDFKFSNANLFSLPAGNVGAAFGTEWRYESFENIYDDRLNGTTVYTDDVTGLAYESDVMGSSGQPNADGSRNVLSAFVEFAGPLISPEMEIPLVHKLDFQVAGRYERYNDVGDVFKPKAVLSWYPVESLQIRGSYAEGFRAPNLEQLHTASTTRVNYPVDYYRCQAQINKGELDSISQCSSGDSAENIRLGNTELDPEKDYNYGLGLVFTPEFIDNLTLTTDYWRIEQEDLIGIRSYQNIADLDYYQRLNGSSNPNVIREEVNADDIAFYEGSGLEAVGDMSEIIGLFENLDSRTTEGLDIGAYYKLNNTSIGDFSFKFNAAKLLKAYQSIDSESAKLQELGLTLDDVGDLIQLDGRPEWQASTTITWRYNNWGAGIYGKYVGDFYDTSAVNDNSGEFWTVDSWTTFSIYGQYTFDQGSLEGTKMRLGVRNLFDKAPPLADETYGYDASLHSAEGRYLYLNLSMSFD
ncbi:MULTISPECIES: TonB-dependent receptor domain-containing protein [Alteromonadaceae]|uniref:TonB-dependent receptor domain-containing protein n=1 Tax=Alteromonadaceae TaxID=72275 RepID=UPI001C0A5DBC|nr:MULTISPECIES: TonB-dependent receptor [Aliiglaciecola]MBU2877539.1 TonB-dependent receptor [Aliiglaciecola lipolytica]MDO6711119.1 TonB-dependent receptor [Aliiglaciecola sp. 2_MG-2023]MDO6752033.1 TonB-dependent receptor [Aliiglaciecola sp. 1_MG-2023]